MKKGGSRKGGQAVSQPMTRVSVASQISDADRALFSPEELAALEAEITLEVQEDMREEARDRVREKLKVQKRAEMQRRIDPDEEMYHITIDLAPFAANITIDNVIYLHGSTYEVPKKLYDTMREVMARTWQHESEIGNANSQFYRKPRNVRLGPTDAGVSASQLMRV